MLFDLQLYLPSMRIFSFVVQDMIDVVGFINGHVLHGVMQGADPFWTRTGLISVLTRNCLIFMALLLTTRNLQFMSWLSSPDEDRIFLLDFSILSTGGLNQN